MHEGNAFAVHIELRFAITQHLRTFAGEIGACGIDVIHADAKMMNATFWVAFEKFRDRRIGSRGLHQLDPGVAEIDVGHAHTLLFVDVDVADFQAVSVKQALGGDVEAGDYY